MGWAVVFLLVVVVLGGAFGLALERRRPTTPPGTGWDLAPSLGFGLLGTVLFWVSLAGLRPHRWVVLGLGAAGLVALLALARGRWRRPDLTARAGPAAVILVLLLVAANAVVAVNAFASGLTAWDAFAMWGLKARVLYHEPVLDAAYFRQLPLAYSQLDYPLLLPFLYAACKRG